MLINLSNHPSAGWSREQVVDIDDIYGKIVDMPFPEVDPEASPEEVQLLAGNYALRVKDMLSAEAQDRFSAVHVMGELTFCFVLVTLLQREGITCLASTTARTVTEHPDGSKTSRFGFVMFREYPMLSGEH